MELVRRHHPRPDVALAEAWQRFALHAAQLKVARSYGFTGWPALVRYLEIAADLSVDPSAIDEAALNPADQLCAWASLRYDDVDAPPRWQAAAALLAADPGLVGRHPAARRRRRPERRLPVVWDVDTVHRADRSVRRR